MTVCTLFVTVVPEAENEIGIIMIAMFLSSIIAGTAAILLWRKFKRNPDSRLFKSKTVSMILIGIAVCLTLFLLVILIG
jgi:hypothetical protein